jgi:hypothetical protein
MANKVIYLQAAVDRSQGDIVTLYEPTGKYPKKYTMTRTDYAKAVRAHERWCQENRKRFNEDRIITATTAGVKEA